MADTLENLNIYIQKTVKRPLDHFQCQRVDWALEFTDNALRECCVPRALAEKELIEVAKELIEAFDAGQLYPNAATELVWTKRAQNHWQYDPALQLRAPQDSGELRMLGAARATGEGGAGLGKGNSAEVAE